MLFSKPMQQAIHALWHLTQLDDGAFMPVRLLAKQAAVPVPVLGKVIQRLARGRLVQTTKGPHGGVRLARAPHDIDLLAILNVIDGPGAFDVCLLGFNECSDVESCLIHREWAPIKEQFLSTLGRLSLAQLRPQAVSQPGSQPGNYGTMPPLHLSLKPSKPA